MSLLPNARILPPKSGEDIESRLEPKTAHEVKNGEWIIDPKSGYPGTISNVKTSKTGKHGHIKVTFQCDMPFSGKTSALMHAGGDRLLSPRMERREFFVSDYNDGEVTLLDDSGNERYMACSTESEVGQKLMGILENDESASLTVLIGPMKKGTKKAGLIEMPEPPTISHENTINEAVQKVITIALRYGGVARGLREAIKAIERDDAHLLILAKDNDEPAYVQTLTALCKEKGVPHLKIDSKMALGKVAGFCKYDMEGKPRKIVKCSSVVITSWGQESNSKTMIMEELEKTK